MVRINVIFETPWISQHKGVVHLFRWLVSHVTGWMIGHPFKDLRWTGGSGVV